jgi:hypothetical protein
MNVCIIHETGEVNVHSLTNASLQRPITLTLAETPLKTRNPRVMRVPFRLHREVKLT